MAAYSLNYVKENLERIEEETVDNCTETILTPDSGKAVVMIPLEEYEPWKETQYLLSSRANREHLLKSIEQSRTGQTVKRDLTDS